VSTHRQVCLIARCRPCDLSLAFGARCLGMIADYLLTSGVVTVISRVVQLETSTRWPCRLDDDKSVVTSVRSRV
jgi:hypothetical protein